METAAIASPGHAEYEELIRSLEDLFRIAIDIKLIELSRRGTGDMYNKTVSDLRARLRPSPQQSNSAEPKDEDEEAALENGYFEEHEPSLSSLLYWFDVRADHWSSPELDDAIGKQVLSRREWVMAQVQGLKATVNLFDSRRGDEFAHPWAHRDLNAAIGVIEHFLAKKTPGISASG